MDEEINETLDLSRRGLKKLEKALTEESKTIINLILDQNELQRLDNIDSYSRIENLSVCNNFLLRMHGVSRLVNLRELALNNNGILQIEGLKDLIYLKVLKLAGNNIKSIEHLNHNMHLEHLDLSNNQISFIADISYLKSLKYLSLERNRLADLRQGGRNLPGGLRQLLLAHNGLRDLNQVAHLARLARLEAVTLQGNPALAAAHRDQLGFDYRPFVLNWILSVKSIDGFVVSAIESLKAEWLYSQGKGRHFQTGQHDELCEYLASTCPLTADALETEDQRKLRLILSKAQQHQQQLKDQNQSPNRSKLQSPRMQSRMTPRHLGRSPERLSSSCHAARGTQSPVTSLDEPRLMSQSFDSPANMFAERAHAAAEHSTPKKPINQPLEAASKMVPVPESLMSPDYQDAIYDLHRPMQKPIQPIQHNSTTSSSNSSVQEERRQIVQPNNINKNMKSSPKLPKSATCSPKLKVKLDQRKGSLTKLDHREETKSLNGKVNGVRHEDVRSDASDASADAARTAGSRRRQRTSEETMAAVTIQRMWRGYRSRNLNKDTLRILHAIQAARSRQHIQRLTCDMEATKAALDSERKIQQLQMQAINALWKKVSTLQANDSQKSASQSEENTEVLRQLTVTCINLQSQVVELQSCMQAVLRAVSAQHPAQHPAQQTAQHPAQQTAQHPAQQTAQHPAQQTAQHPAQQTAQHPAQQTAQHPAQQTAQHPAQQTAQHPAQQTAQHPAQHPAQQTAQLSDQQTAQHSAQHPAQQTAQLSDQQTAQHSAQHPAQQTAQLLDQQTAQHPAQPAATQTDISALATPQEERWLRRPQSLPLAPLASAAPPSRSVEEFEQLEKHSEQETLAAVSELGTLDTTGDGSSPGGAGPSAADSTVTGDVTSDVTLSE